MEKISFANYIHNYKKIVKQEKESMKVKVIIARMDEVEIEVDDKFDVINYSDKDDLQNEFLDEVENRFDLPFGQSQMIDHITRIETETRIFDGEEYSID